MRIEERRRKLINYVDTNDDKNQTKIIFNNQTVQKNKPPDVIKPNERSI